MFGVPFQGYDYYMDGKGGMKGVLAKLFTLFDQTGPEMDKACLITYLAEAFFLPEAFLKDFITFKQIDEHTVEATITNKGVTASGVFHFNDSYEMTSFTTNDRGQIAPDGTIGSAVRKLQGILGRHQATDRFPRRMEKQGRRFYLF